MNRSLRIAALTMIIAVASNAQHTVGGWDPDDLKNAEETVATFNEKDDGLDKFFKNARGYVVYSTVAKAAMGIGGAHGKGIVYEEGKAIGKSSLTQVTYGFQLGGQAFSEIIFFENKKAMERFKEGNFEFSAQASVVAVTLGASADLAYRGGIAVVTMAKGGLMYEASVGGQKFSYDPIKKDEDDKEEKKEAQDKTNGDD